MAMTKSQQEYALKRLKEVYEEKQKGLKSKYTSPAKRLGEKEKLSLIQEQKVLMKDKDTFYRYTYLIDAYDFTGWEHEESTTPEGVTQMAELTARYEDACDLVMLGDAVEALEAIKNFN